MAFAAVHPEPDNGFAANITIDGEYRLDEATLTEIAEESVLRMRELDGSLVVLHRKEAGSGEAPALTQTLRFSTVTGGVHRDLVQIQVYLVMLDVHDASKRAVIRLALTAAANQIDSVLGDFQDFVSTVRPDSGSK
ncbi:hypothetical protein ACFQ0X_13270 [Streptomyces rectiviolaceus]|uniref:hypothetical protein n=1 Tax=Streptomyces rectiviolaceus TaxID=332591 RepID=UPI0031D0AFEA